MEFKDTLKELRRKKHMTQENLAREIHVSRSAIAKWEAGLGIPSEDSLEVICIYFGVEKIQLMPNVETEEVFVDKNLKIRKGRRLIFTLGAILWVLLVILLTFGVYKGVEKIKRRNEIEIMKMLVPTVQKVYFENPTMVNIEDVVPMVEGKYVLQERKWTKVYFEVDVDERISNSWYDFTPVFEGFEVIAFQEISYRYIDVSTTKRFCCSIYVRPLDLERTELNITSLNYFHIIDGEGYSVDCEIDTKALPICISGEE